MRFFRRVSGVLWWYVRSLVHSLMLHCDRILLGSILNLIEVERKITYKLPLNPDLSFKYEFRIRGSNLTTWN